MLVGAKTQQEMDKVINKLFIKKYSDEQCLSERFVWQIIWKENFKCVTFSFLICCLNVDVDWEINIEIRNMWKNKR